jgi:hypothetical protein
MWRGGEQCARLDSAQCTLQMGAAFGSWNPRRRANFGARNPCKAREERVQRSDLLGERLRHEAIAFQLIFSVGAPKKSEN